MEKDGAEKLPGAAAQALDGRQPPGNL